LNRVMKPYVDAYYNLFPDRAGNDVVSTGVNNKINEKIIGNVPSRKFDIEIAPSDEVVTTESAARVSFMNSLEFSDMSSEQKNRAWKSYLFSLKRDRSPIPKA